MSDKETFTDLVKSMHRAGISNLLYNLNHSDFFEAPCSTKYHLCYKGGLVAHSLNVYSLLRKKVEDFSLNVSEDTVKICALFHDLCKIGCYHEEEENGKRVWKYRDEFPFGHGEKSVSILQECIVLTKAEKLAIRWHMNAYDDAKDSYALQDAMKMEPLVTLLFTADIESARILEK